jgi:hypothetical protein
MRLPSILLALIALNGCAARHWEVCAAGASNSGCSSERMTEKEAKRIGEFLAAAPVDEEFKVWIIDAYKHDAAKAKQPKAVENPSQPSKEPEKSVPLSNYDSKI